MTIQLSVIVATTHKGATLAPCVARLRPQLVACGGELLLIDGSEQGDAVGPEIAVEARVIREPLGDVFRLRELGARAARGAVIAFTEDHCLPEADWCEKIIAAHARSPSTDLIAGATSNGSASRLVDRANFLTTFAHVLPPLNGELGRRAPTINNLSIKSRALDTRDLVPGRIEFELLPELRRAGQLLLDDRIRVAHIQSHGTLLTPVVHFHNGRSTTGLPRRRIPWCERAIRALDSVLLVPRHLAETWREVSRRPGHRRTALPAMPWVVVLLVAHSLGQIAGLIGGPGNSPRALE